MGLLASQPGKGIWTLLAIAFNTVRLPIWMIYYLPASLRPHPQWSYRQAILVQIVKSWLWNASMVQMKTPIELAPQAEKERWAVAEPVAKYYTDVATSDPDVKPIPIGGTWYPAIPSGSTGKVVMHLHGGAYVIGDGRSKDAGFAAQTMLENTEVTHVFAPQYRLSSNPGCAFPAALQDAITAYTYLLNEAKVPANKIVISGDSAGANLSLSLVRYLTEHDSSLDLPGPLAAWLWSPWVSPVASLSSDGFDSSPNISTDYLSSSFGTWGALTYQPSKKTGLSLASPYISFENNAFATKTPLYISTGECEVLFHDDVKLYEQFKAILGNKVELQIEEYAVHDLILAGKLVGFEKEAVRAAKRAGKWLETI